MSAVTRAIQYVSLWSGQCGLSNDTPAQILRREGSANVKHIHLATEKDVAWIRGMGGKVPDGRIAEPKVSA